MNLKEKTKPGVCEAMRCTAEAVRVVAGWGRDDVRVCAKHYGQALADGDIAIDVEGVTVSASSAPAPDATPETDYRAEIERWKGEAVELVEVARGFEITTRDEYELAAEVLADVKGHAKRIEARKQEITKPMNAALKSVRDLFRPAETAFGEAESILKDAIARFALDEDRRNREALAAAGAALASGDDEAAREELARVATARSTEGLGVREVWVFEVIDAAAVPRELCSPDESKIRAYVKLHGGAEPNPVPGMRFTKSAVVSSRSA